MDTYDMNNQYESPFNTRYASNEMKQLFSPNNKFRTFRYLWIALAEGEKKLGLPISDEQIAELEKYKDDINFDVAIEQEKLVRHDVMAHVHAYGVQAEKAKGIIHLGATSCYVGDNTDLIIMRDGLELIKKKLVAVIGNLEVFARKYKDLPTLGFTHFQPAQLTTVGKRACLWIQDLMLDLEEINFVIESIQFLGSKGTTGTQASFMSLFENDGEKVKELEKYIASKFGFKKVYPVTGQTYTRKTDSRVINVLSQIAQSSHKFSNDIRLLQHLKEVEEPYEKNQIGSSAMAYKRNPMRTERMASLARYVIVNSLNPAITASTQWFERTLDDSANKRIAVAEAFLGIDSILNVYLNVTDGLVVYPKIIERRIMEELPFMATENIMMDAVKCGGDRQEIHEAIRTHSVAASNVVKNEGKPNDLIERILNDDTFGISEEELRKTLKPEAYIGRSVQQVEEFLDNDVLPVLKENNHSKIHSELTV